MEDLNGDFDHPHVSTRIQQGNSSEEEGEIAGDNLSSTHSSYPKRTTSPTLLCENEDTENKGDSSLNIPSTGSAGQDDNTARDVLLKNEEGGQKHSEQFDSPGENVVGPSLLSSADNISESRNLQDGSSSIPTNLRQFDQVPTDPSRDSQQCTQQENDLPLQEERSSPAKSSPSTKQESFREQLPETLFSDQVSPTFRTADRFVEAESMPSTADVGMAHEETGKEDASTTRKESLSASYHPADELRDLKEETAIESEELPSHKEGEASERLGPANNLPLGSHEDDSTPQDNSSEPFHDNRTEPLHVPSDATLMLQPKESQEVAEGRNVFVETQGTLVGREVPSYQSTTTRVVLDQVNDDRDAIDDTIFKVKDEDASNEDVKMEVAHVESIPSPVDSAKTDASSRSKFGLALLKVIDVHKRDDLQFAKITKSNQVAANLATLPERAPAFMDFSVENKSHEKYGNNHKAERVRSVLTKTLQQQRLRKSAKLRLLCNRYRQFNKEWKAHCERMDRLHDLRESQQRPSLTASVSTPGLSNSISGHPGMLNGDDGILAAQVTSSARTNRRNPQSAGFGGFGDAVRSEAEFLEILASLENADMQDPSARAARTTATEPEMMINPDSDSLLQDPYDDDNGYVADPETFYNSEFDPDVWTEEEKAIFDRRYALYPKQFGKIAASLPNKSAKQCVSYYYMTKKLPDHDYKALSALRNRDRKRKSRVKPKKGRGSALMADLKGGDVEEVDGGSPLEESSHKKQISRSRVLTGQGVMELESVTEEAEPTEVSASRKRQLEDGNEDGKRARIKAPKRGKSEKKSKAMSGESSTTTPAEPLLTPDEENFAAAEALGALAGLATSSMGKKRKPTQRATPATAVEGGHEEAHKKSRQSTSSYWSVSDRNQFLRSLAIFGKEWDAIAENLTSKSAAQARNYFVRNAEEADFVEAVVLAKKNSELSVEQRSAYADEFLQDRMITAQTNIERTSEYVSEIPVQSDTNGAHKSGLNISSLLNTNSTDHAPDERHWFSKDAQSDDDTEEEDGPPRISSFSETKMSNRPYFHSQSPEVEVAAEHGRPSSAPYNMYDSRISSGSMPPPSSFVHGDYRPRQMSAHPQPVRYASSEFAQRPMTVSGPSHYHQSGYPSYPNARESYQPHSRSVHSPLYSRASPVPPISINDGTNAMWKRESSPGAHRHSSWPAGYSGMHLAPRQPTSDYRTSDTSFSNRGRLSSSPIAMRSTLPSLAFERSSSRERPSTSSMRSESPHPPPSIPTAGSFFQRRDESSNEPASR